MPLPWQAILRQHIGGSGGFSRVWHKPPALPTPCFPGFRRASYDRRRKDHRRCARGLWQQRPARTAIPQTSEKLLGFLDQISQRSRMQKLVDLPGRPGGRASVPLPEGARFETRVYADAVRTRAYKLYVPSSLRIGLPVPLVVMLHGCTQSPDDFAARTRMNTLAEEQKFLVAYPTQATSANAQKCWNWSSPADQERGCGEPALIAAARKREARRRRVGGAAAAAIMGKPTPISTQPLGYISALPVVPPATSPRPSPLCDKGELERDARADGKRSAPNPNHCVPRR